MGMIVIDKLVTAAFPVATERKDNSKICMSALCSLKKKSLLCWDLPKKKKKKLIPGTDDSVTVG